MNRFEQTFFQKYVPEWQDIKWVIHEHWIKIVRRLITRIGLFTFVPSFLYYYSDRLKQIIPFVAFECFLLLVFTKLMYDIFNWYNDVWIVTQSWVIDLDWALFKTSSVSIKYDNIEWIWVEQSWIWDKILNKWDVVIHKVWNDEFRLVDAKIPYEALDEIERISRQSQKAGKQDEKDRFDLIMESLWGVVEDYLERKGMTKKEVISENREFENRPMYEEEIIADQWLSPKRQQFERSRNVIYLPAKYWSISCIKSRLNMSIICFFGNTCKSDKPLKSNTISGTGIVFFFLSYFSIVTSTRESMFFGT